MPPIKWRKRQAFKRKTDFRPIEVDDVRYAWVVYKGGGFNSFDEGLDPASFKVAFTSMVMQRFDAAWTLFANTKNGWAPAGIALGFYPHPEATRFLIMDTFVWFPWATPRNRIECAAKFFKEIDVPMMGFSRKPDTGFFEVMAKLGLLRRVGTSVNVFPKEATAVWETKGNG